jgi:hypothetical protein
MGDSQVVGVDPNNSDFLTPFDAPAIVERNLTKEFQ